MTINSTTRKAGPFVGNGTVSAFPFGFKVFQASDLFVVRLNVSAAVEQTLVLNSDYSVTLNPDQNSNPGGVVTLSSALASGYTLTLTSDVPDTQPTDLTNQGGFYPEVINDALDRATIQIQQLQEEIDRTITAPISTPAGTDLTFPLPEANQFIGWNSTATGLQNLDGSTLASIVAFATAYADTFNGDGATSTFALSYPPATVRNLDVSINGVTQVPVVDYNINGQTLNFTTPPPLGSVVLAKYWQALPNSSGAAQDFTLTPNGYTTAVDVQEGFDDLGSSAGTSKVGFLQAGTGAQARSAQDKLRDIVSVKDFGAIGDGVTDDTAAIQAAITACADGDRLLFPAGDYLVTSSLTVPSTSYLEGAPGAAILAGANNLAVFTTSGFTTGVSFNSIAIQGNGKTGVVAFNLSNVQFHSQLDNINVYECAKGIVLDAICIGIAIKNPTIFKTPNAIEIKGNSNANTITTPNIDNAVGTAGGTGTGTGVYILGGTNQIYGGFIQGFEFGIYDEGEYTGLDGVYLETCTNSAVFSYGAVAGTYKNVFYFGYNATPAANYAFVGANCSGMTILYPSMVQGNSTGGLYYYVNGNTNCTEAHIANDGTSNTNVGTPSQLSPIGNATSQYKPFKIKNGTLATGATATPLTFNVASPNSISLCEVTLVAQEQTGFVATSSRKFIFTLTNTAGTLTASAVSTDAAYTIDVSSPNYGITVGAPTVTIINPTSANFEFSLTTAGAIGWANCNYTVTAAMVGSSTNYIS